MRSIWVFSVALVLVGLTMADSSPELVAKQKKAADDIFARLQTTKLVRAETDHFYAVGTAADARLKSMLGSFEKVTGVMIRALQYESNAVPWNGKLVVYVLADAPALKSFIRQVEKRSPQAEEIGTAKLDKDSAHVAVMIWAGKDAPQMEAVAIQRLGGALLADRAKTDRLPEWLVAGFARAAVASGTPAGPRKREIQKLGLPVTAAWTPEVPVETRNKVAASLVEYMIFGKAVKVGAFLEAFRPTSDQMDIEKPTSSILEAVELTPEKLDLGWKQWLAKP